MENNEIYQDIEVLVQFAEAHADKRYQEEVLAAAKSVELWMASMQPNHLTSNEDGD